SESSRGASGPGASPAPEGGGLSQGTAAGIRTEPASLDAPAIADAPTGSFSDLHRTVVGGVVANTDRGCSWVIGVANTCKPGAVALRCWIAPRLSRESRSS